MEGQETLGVTQRSFSSPIYTFVLIVQRDFGLAKKELINIRVFV